MDEFLRSNFTYFSCIGSLLVRGLFSNLAAGRYCLVVAHELLIAVASFVEEHRL